MRLKLKRYSKNPILTPQYWWENRGVFNPAVTKYKDKIVMLYRAQGDDGISRFGLATSINGKKFEKTSKLPILEADTNDEYSRVGYEDPRVTKISDTYFITYTCASVYPANEKSNYEGHSGVPWRIRIGLITTKDWQKFDRHGVILANLDSKNAALFPQKFDDKYALIHRVHHHMHISFSSKINQFNEGKVLMIADGIDWQEIKIGLCSPPIIFENNWLSTFHGIDKDKRYSIGFVYFDKDNPMKILYRSSEPILSPRENYETHGAVANVVFTTGLIEKDDQLYIYYGAADNVICLATIQTDEVKDVLSNKN